MLLTNVFFSWLSWQHFHVQPTHGIFLSGLATELFILICDSNSLNKTHSEETVKLDTSKRINRWQEWFTNFCIPMFDKHKEEYEQSQFTDGSYNLNPFEVDSSMLISASDDWNFFFSGRNLQPARQTTGTIFFSGRNRQHQKLTTRQTDDWNFFFFRS